MQILFLTSGPNVPSSRFRILQWIPHLERLGHQCTVAPARPAKYDAYRWLGWRLSQRFRKVSRWLDWWMSRCRRVDVVVVERELSDDDSTDLERRFRQSLRTFILDVDDGIFLRHPEKFDCLARMADLVIAGNAAIAERARTVTRKVVTIPTCVDTDVYTPAHERPAGPPTLGWIGTSSNLPYLRRLAPVLRAVQQRHDCRLRLIVDESPEIELLRGEGVHCDWIPWSSRREIAELRQLDIGLMPLPDDEWSRHKCGFKLLQYMAVGLPAVASPVGVNREIVVSGQTGFLAATDVEWEAALESLLSDAELRRRLGTAGRERTVQNYSVASHLDLWVSAVTAAADGTAPSR